MDEKVPLIDNTEEQLAGQRVRVLFQSGKQKEIRFARDQIKSNLTRKIPSKPKQQKS